MNSPVLPLSLSELALQLKSSQISGIIEKLPADLGNVKANDFLLLDFIDSEALKDGIVGKIQISLYPQGTFAPQAEKSQTPATVVEAFLNIKLNLSGNLLSEQKNLQLGLKVVSPPSEGKSVSVVLTSVNNKRPEVFFQELAASRPGVMQNFEQAVNIELSSGASTLKNNLPEQQGIPSFSVITGQAVKNSGRSGEAFLPLALRAENVFPELMSEAAAFFSSLPEEIKQQVMTAMLNMPSVSGFQNRTGENFEELVRDFAVQFIRLLQNSAGFSPEGAGLEQFFYLLSVKGQENVPTAKNILPQPELTLKELLSPDAGFDISQTGNIRDKKLSLPEILAPLRRNVESFKLLPQLIEKIPNPAKNDFISTLVNYVKAAKENNLSRWLGKDMILQLSSSTVEAKEVSDNLNVFLNISNRESAGWKMIEIPVVAGNFISYIKMAVRKEDEKKSTSAPRKENGTRFMVDTTLSALGKIQFDGMSFEKKRHFDLIIRTEKLLPADINNMIKNIFSQSLNEMKYTGTISIKFKENFIKPWDNPVEKSLSNGILV